ncbi:DUF3072 domain-containing protein [Sphaerisporangium album]|uniref:DUF3072 domain-containing protein n=1 Tax=Sphaerisporangium album TaxID=509200 RepID=A0A367F0X8_9ACTN|nr:DUF3072 domain-containing protein [Sphaerisporangium album]RCG24026.1 DUF3072 domain-containing protein [Sphaerisporangium album]
MSQGPVDGDVSRGPVQKDPEDWATGDEPMTAPQESYLHTLAREAGREVPEGLSKAEASKLIDELQEESTRLRQGS